MYLFGNYTIALCTSMETVQLLFASLWKLYSFSMYLYENVTNALSLLNIYGNNWLNYHYLFLLKLHNFSISVCTLWKLFATLSVYLYENYLLLYLHISLETFSTVSVYLYGNYFYSIYSAYLYGNYLLLYLYISMETIYYSICISLWKLFLLFQYISIETIYYSICVSLW